MQPDQLILAGINRTTRATGNGSQSASVNTQGKQQTVNPARGSIQLAPNGHGYRMASIKL